MKTDIRNRYDIVVKAARTSLDKALASVDDVIADTERELASSLEEEQRNADTICQLQGHIQVTADKDYGCELTGVIEEMQKSGGIGDFIHSVTSQSRTTMTRPVLQYTTSAEAAIKHVNHFIGAAAKVNMSVDGRHTTTVERFNIAEDPGAEVFSTCVTDNGNVTLSYAWRDFSNNAYSETFSMDGRHVSTSLNTGKVTLKSMGQREMYYNQKERKKLTFFKSKTHFLLINSLSGTAIVEKTTVTSEDPFKATTTTEFIIRCGPHHAFDVDSTGDLFAVVEEPNDSNTQRKVRVLFTRPQGGTATTDRTYESPLQPFQPSDVCFYSTDLKEALLVADEINDAIHVVIVRCGRLEFVHYLCPECPLLTQPTALTVDNRNRLWVACRGRRILIMKP